jgi:hypothetical protein
MLAGRALMFHLHAGLAHDVLGEGSQVEALRLRCALMRLSLPIDLLAAQLLQLPLGEAASAAI